MIATKRIAVPFKSYTCTCAMIVALLAGPALSQSDTEPSADTDPNASAATDEEAAPTPEFNGRAAGRFINADLNVPVLCTGMGTGTLTAQSDPGDSPGEDTNGDNTVVDITAANSGDISMNMLAGGISLNFADTSAVVENDTIRYAITASITGGADERIDLTITCN